MMYVYEVYLKYFKIISDKLIFSSINYLYY